ncbi:hypothetical protein [Elizabethkingia anophelis]|uniref:hypothetical protein n=1 Tax=Elizabethkingia anophelis TaxID=1117645 RepID=UPI0038921FD0
MALKKERLQNQILAASVHLEHKNAFVNKLEENVKKDQNFNLSVFLKKEQLIDRDFNTIKDLIQETHPNFFKKLNAVSKNKLTHLDIKYATYIYINMDNTHIASVLSVDPKTVRVTKHRLKQKIGLEKDDDLQTFLQGLV